MAIAHDSTQELADPSDIGPLAWVEPELRRQLDAALKDLRRFHREASRPADPDLPPPDPALLRAVRKNLHQAGGALEMVGMPPLSRLLASMEAAVEKFAAQPASCDEAAVSVVERAVFALGEYLDALLGGKPYSAVGLFPQYRALQALTGVSRVHPADLWAAPATPEHPPRLVGEPVPLAYGPAARAQFDQKVLSVVKTGDADAARTLSELSLRLAAAQPEGEARSFWQVCAGFFEAQALDLLPRDLHAKRVASRVLMQYTGLARGAAVQPQLLQDMLFFCAHAAAHDAASAPALEAVRDAWAMPAQAPVDYEHSRFGRFDPAQLAQARKRIANAAETWSALAGGDRARIKAAADQFGLVADSLQRLHPQDTTLADALTRALSGTVRRGVPPGTALAMEVATSVLYLQAAYEELDTSDQTMTERAAVLAGRLDRAGAAAASAVPEPLAGWMEDLYRRVSERQTMGSVVEELRSTLHEAEKALDAFFRAPDETPPLLPVPGHLAQMRGVLSVLGLDQATQAVVRLRDNVERLLLGQPAEAAERAVVFDAIGSSLGALGFLIDMLAYQPALARRLFVFDEAEGVLRAVMAQPAAAAVLPPAPPEPLETPEAPAIAAPVALEEVRQDGEDDGSELREIFLEEAREVIADGLACLDALDRQPAEMSRQTALRRAFHTLKGSARMVQLDRFAEAAWSMEQLLNGWLAEQTDMPQAWRDLSRQSLIALGRWAEDIASGADEAWDSAPFRSAADALRQQGEVADSTTAAPAESSGAPAEPQESDLDFPELPAPVPPPRETEAQELPVLEERIEPVEEPVAISEPEPEPELEPEPEPEPAADEMKAIDGLRIPIPLYNVYLNEADEWSRRLLTELTEWSLELHRPLPEAASPLAHSLAGSSATVGFEQLSVLARLLEQALDHIQHQTGGTPHQAGVFVDTAEDIRRLLHQFAAGFLKEPRPRLLRALQALVDIAPEEAEAPSVAQFLRSADAEPAPVAETTPEPEAAMEPEPEPERAPQALAEVAEVADIQDKVDPDLFPVFEEEALDMLPRFGALLRRWVERPDDPAPRAEILRLLHTLKGSSRLAGAMRLGERAHRFETAIEALPQDGLDSAQVEALFAHADAMQAELDALRADDAQAHAEAPRPPAGKAVEQPAQKAVSHGVPVPVRAPLVAPSRDAGGSVRVRAVLLDRLVNEAGEVMISRSRLESRLAQMQHSLAELGGNLERLRGQLRDVEVQSESQMQSRLALARDSAAGFDPLESDRFTRVQELTRMMAESVDDVATVQRNLQRGMQGAEDELVAQGRQARELQRDLLRTRMVEFDNIAERLHAVVRQTARDTGKTVALDIAGGAVEMDRGVLERLLPPFEHLLRNAVVHGIEAPAARVAAGKPATGQISITVRQDGNDVALAVADDGAGLDLVRIREKAAAGAELSDAALADLIFAPGFTTVTELTELAGRGIGMDVVRSAVQAAGGQVEVHSQAGKGTRFDLALPLTTAVTQVLLLRAGGLTIGVPATVVEVVRRVGAAELDAAYAEGTLAHGGEAVPFFWCGALLQSSAASQEPATRTRPVVLFRSAHQRVALHVDEVLGQQEVVVKNLGPQLARLPGLSAMTVLPSGAVLLVYNPVALVNVYGERIRAAIAANRRHAGSAELLPPVDTGAAVPLVLVVDDSITVRRVTQRLLRREGWRVALAADGLQALERLREERPALVLSDIEMPRMDGFDLLRQLRADPATADLPVVMITSRIAAKHREYAMSLGASHYLGKPYPEEELLALVRRYTALRTAE